MKQSKALAGLLFATVVTALPLRAWGFDVTSVTNGKLTVSLDADAERMTITGGPAGFKATLMPAEVAAKGATGVKVVEFDDVYGKTKAIEIEGPGGKQYVWVQEGQPFVFSRVDLKKAGDAPINKVVTLSAVLDSQSEATTLFTSAGLSSAGKEDTSYTFLAVVDPKSRGGVVSGWLTHERASGVVNSKPGENTGDVTFAARAEYGRLVIDDGATAKGEVFAIGVFDDAHEGLETLADAMGKYNGIKLRRPISGYSTWYHARALDERRMKQLSDWAKETHLDEFGFDFLQIDDQWQVSRRDFTTHKTGEKANYPSGMKATAENITKNGFIAGLWLTPFAWHGKDERPAKMKDDGTVSKTPNDTVLKDRKDWFVKRQDGSVYDVYWAWDCLDMSHPEARKFLSGVIYTMTHDWGYKLLKIDGLWAGMACPILYPDPKYRDEGLGDAVFHDKTKTNIDVYRDGLKLVREAAGPETFILGCNIAQNMRTLGGSIGLADSMRIGPDIAASWDKVVRCAKPAGWLYFFNNRVWWNDPDCLMLRDPLTVEMGRAWGSFIAISGQLHLVSEWLPDLPAEKLDVLKRTIPNVPHDARPVDLFEREMPRIWHAGYGEGEGQREVIGLFNWTDPNPRASTRGTGQEEPTEATGRLATPKEAAELVVDFGKAGLEGSKTYLAFDFWGDELVGEVSGSKTFTVKPGSCVVLAVQEKRDRPQVLSTSRHVMQGLVDLGEVKWEGDALAGKSKLVIGDPYELRIPLNGWKAGEMKVSGGEGVRVTQRVEGDLLRVRMESSKSQEVGWRVGFTK